ncbi:hypothetical protein BDR06DRAFT_955870 [Suillus hirtellus]|nr:hypothetical protein BDR06DRAFT_955870 [Suillus hirtellus]
MEEHTHIGLQCRMYVSGIRPSNTDAHFLSLSTCSCITRSLKRIRLLQLASNQRRCGH